MLYQMYETQRALMAPFSEFASATAKLYNHPLSPFSHTPMAQRVSAGFDLAHPALAGRMLPGWDFVDGDADPSETAQPTQGGYGHGTHVAGLVAWVAPGARLLPLRVLDAEGQGNAWVLAEAMLHAVDPDHNPATAAKLSEVLQATPDIPYDKRIQTARFIEDLTASYQGGWYSVISLHGGGSPAAMKQEIWRNYPVGSKVELVERLLERGVLHDEKRGITKNRQPGKCCDTGCTTPGQPVMVALPESRRAGVAE